MKLTAPRAILLKPLQIINGVVEKRQTLPILSNVLIEAQGETLSMTATDLEIELIGSVPVADIVAEGRTTVSARKLLDICRALPEDAIVTMTSEGEQMIVRSGKSRFVLTTLPANDFPNVDNGPFPIQFVVNQAKFRKLMSKTHFAMGQQDVRHYLNGALFDINQGVIKCVATDGHRLAYSTMEDDNLTEILARVILPRKSVLELSRLLDANGEETISVCIGENHFRVTTTEFIFTSKLISAQYPDYDKLIPRSIKNTAIASREGLKQALVRASILSNEKFRGIRLHLDNNQLRIVANNPEQEEAEVMLDLDYTGAGFEIGFNAAYLLDAVSAIGTDDIRWSFNDADSGMLIEPQGAGDSLYVVMPMRL